ncbi:hypothetical protein IHE45_02G027000 [Dioscorea alata]|uniref:Uncharacterized protein n=1 Tax=Dioscorea alata TaxID=55571 RepID=A0ACB7WPP0_DIOAL|nr:hypothetical protein IHE45_02G027000 [Dioscorea alata]
MLMLPCNQNKLRILSVHFLGAIKETQGHGTCKSKMGVGK